ncbi:GNAT family N-acetyltransferase [Streptomyces sp. NPDC097619]|uniref:GNAT family N-acetyltransferase n=1 Tax=Streptomyces sp. NPDC097619 TaxID=3157228 RepID=UPI00332E319C
MDIGDVRDLYDREMRRDAPPDGPDARVERVGDVVRQTAPPLGWNGVLWSGLDAAGADAAITAQVAHFAGLPDGARTWEWKLYAHDGPADLGARLRAAGFEEGEPETLMVAETAALPREPVLPEGVRLVPVTDASGVDLMMRAHDGAFGGPPRPDLRHQLLTRVTSEPDRIAAVVALAGDRPVSAARLELTPGRSFGGLWGGGTVPEWRGRGIYRAMTAYRARIAAERGVRYLQVDATGYSRPILGRLGFSELGTTREYVWHAASDGAGGERA